MPGSREEDFKRNNVFSLYDLYGHAIAQEPLHINFTLFTPKLPPLWVGRHEIYNFLSPYPTDATYQIWLRLAQ